MTLPLTTMELKIVCTVMTVVATAAPGLLTHTCIPVAAAPGVPVVRRFVLTATDTPLTTDTVPEMTVVPAPAVTVPVMTTGKAVVDCPPTIHMFWPVALIDGTAVVMNAGVAVMVPDTTVVKLLIVTVPLATTFRLVPVTLMTLLIETVPLICVDTNTD